MLRDSAFPTPDELQVRMDFLFLPLAQFDPVNWNSIPLGNELSAFQRHLIEVNKWLAGKSNVQVSRVHYHRVLREPKAVAGEIAAFLGVPLDIEAMVRQVDGSLYRNRMK